MRVLGLCSYSVEAAATRFRMEQFIEPLSARGIELTIKPFLTGKQFSGLYGTKGFSRTAVGMLRPFFKRIWGVRDVRKYDLIFVQREAMLFGPPIFEWLYQKLGNIPMVLDLDDATYVRYISPRFGRSGSFFKFFGKTDKLIKRAAVVVCGNRFIEQYVKDKGAKTIIIPTVVDTDIFCPVEKKNEIPVIGWIGTHSTFPSLEFLFPVLQKLAEKHRFILKIVGAGQKVSVENVNVDNVEWKMDRELADFQMLDIGLYPITLGPSANEEWILGKSGFKAIQYMAVGIPYVMSPVGVGAEIGDPGKTHFNAETSDDWYNSLDKLLSKTDLRAVMGQHGREYSLEHYSLAQYADTLASVLRTAGNRHK